MDKFPPSPSVACIHKSLIKWCSHPCSNVDNPIHPRPPSCSCSRYISLYDLFFQTISIFSHQMAKCVSFLLLIEFRRLLSTPVVSNTHSFVSLPRQNTKFVFDLPSRTPLFFLLLSF